jgi:hypothetical protein
MATIKIPPGQLGAVLETHARKLPQATRAGLSLAAEQGRKELARKIPVYRGVLQNAWEIRTQTTGSTAAVVTNTAPYAGIVERGARPTGPPRRGERRCGSGCGSRSSDRGASSGRYPVVT